MCTGANNGASRYSYHQGALQRRRHSGLGGGGRGGHAQGRPVILGTPPACHPSQAIIIIILLLFFTEFLLYFCNLIHSFIRC